MTTQQDKELSSDLIADVAREAFAHALKGGNIWALDTLPKRVELAHALATSPQLPVAEQPAGQVVSDAEIVEWSKQFGHYEESRWGVDTNPVPQFHSSEIAIVKMVRTLLAAPHSPVAQISGDADENAPWLTQAHLLCTDVGVPQGAIGWRLEVLRGILLPDDAASHPSNAVQDAPKPFAWAVGTFDLFKSFDEAQRNVRNPSLKPEPLFKAATVPQVAQAPLGWKLVPIEPTELMADAAYTECEKFGISDCAVHLWDAMLAAAPQPVAASPSIVPTDAIPLLRRLKRDLMNARRFSTETLSTYRNACISAESDIEEFLTTTSNAGEAAQGDKS